MSTSSSPVLKVFTYDELKTATKNFRPDNLFGVGEGRFGNNVYYKGWIDEQTLCPSKHGFGIPVYVRKLEVDHGVGGREWLTIANYLSQVNDPNVVKLIGYCLDGENPLLVHEFMTEGSLENHLFKLGHQPLSWETRIKVAMGTARGLSFLHDGQSKIIYRDFKPSKILLDEEFNAKLSDFDLAKLGPEEDQAEFSTEVIGTYGYAAPEYIATGRLSTMCDVYSYGVVLLELLTGFRAIDPTGPPGQQSLVEWALPYLRNKTRMEKIMDPKLEGSIYPKKAAFRLGTIALECLSQDPTLRPKMCKVVEELDKLQYFKSPAESENTHTGGKSWWSSVLCMHG